MSLAARAAITIVGDGCDPMVLASAGVTRADVVVADTGDDEDNLVVCLVTKKQSKARCIARVNNPKNKLIFESIDLARSRHGDFVDRDHPRTINEHVNAAKLQRSMLETMQLFGNGDMELVKIAVAERTRRSMNKRLVDIGFRATASSSRSNAGRGPRHSRRRYEDQAGDRSS